MTTATEAVIRAEAVGLLLEVAEAGVVLRCRQYVELRIAPDVWREIQVWANAMRGVQYKGVRS